MKHTFGRALQFIESKFGSTDCTVLGCDIDSEGNLYIYSNTHLEGYSKTNGIYEKIIKINELTKSQRDALHRYLVVGPSVRQTNLPDSDKIYTQDLETELFRVNKQPEYVFIQSKDITKEFIGDNDLYVNIIRSIETNPEDSILVHEFAHRIQPKIRRKLAKRFGLGKDKDFSKKVQEEMFAKYTEMLYLEENYPEIAEKRRKHFEAEINEGEKESPHGRDPHPAASKLYFALEKKPELRNFVDSLYTGSVPEIRD